MVSAASEDWCSFLPDGERGEGGGGGGLNGTALGWLMLKAFYIVFNYL